MKKLLLIIFCMIFCLSLTACFESDSPKKETSDIQSSAENTDAENEEESFHLNETAVFSDLKFTAAEIKESGGELLFGPESGNVFVGINFEVENISNEEQTISSLLLFDGYADDIKCEYSLSAAAAFGAETLDDTLAPGKKMTGWYALEVPENWTEIELHVKQNWLSSSSAKFVFEK